MEIQILSSIYQLLSKMVDKQASNQQALIDAIDEVKTAISNIQIEVGDVSFDASDLEAKIDTTNEKLDTINTSIGTVGTNTENTTNKVTTLSNNIGYFNPTHIATVASGDTTFDQDVVLCNITENVITISVTPKDNTAAISIAIQPGWCPVIVKSITGAAENTLVYGW